MDEEYSFGRWIRKRRKGLELTQAELAEQVGYSTAMIRKIENDERRPSRGGAELLAEALGIPQEQQDAFLRVALQKRPVDTLGAATEDAAPFPWTEAPHFTSNLPLPATLCVGREEELSNLGTLLQDTNCRLVTVVGLAGIGKTRLAIQVAHDLLDRFEHGEFFVSLAPLESPEMIVTTIAKAVGFQFRGEVGPQEQLLRYLREKHMLLVLDNFEHLMEGVNLLPAIMQAAPGVQLLVTSRERLNLRGEWVFEVEGLSYPRGREERGWGRIESYGSVQLFTQAAVRAHPSFSLNEENRRWVVRICQLTEGLPLGIELAAAWVRVLSCQEIAEEIERSLDFLRASARDIPERHRSLRAALDHSWNLLSAKEKAVFRRLSVFRGGFRREAAHEVAGASLQEITSLLDKSILNRVGEERYDLHELVRHYGAMHLKSNAQEHTRTHDRHSNYYAALLKQWEAKLTSPRHLETITEMDIEMDNVRLAWSWMLERKQITNIHISQRSLFIFHQLRGQFREAVDLMRRAAEALEAADDMQGEDSLVLLSYIFLAQQAYEKAYSLASEGLAICRAKVGYPHAKSYCLITLSAAASHLGRLVEAKRWVEESLQISKSLNDRWSIAQTLRQLGPISFALGETTRAESLIRQSVALFRELGDRTLMATALIELGVVTHTSENPAKSKQYLLEALRTAIDTQTEVIGMQALVEIAAAIVMEKGASVLALELVTYALHHSATSQETKTRAEGLRAKLVAHLTPQQIESAREQAQNKSLEKLGREILAVR